MQKFIGVILFLCAVMILGYKVSQRFILRRNFLKSYLNFIKYIENESKYTRDILIELIKNYFCHDEMSEFLNLFRKNFEKGQEVDHAWDLALEKIKKKYYLKEEDCKGIYNFGFNLGKSDLEGQIANCELAFNLAKHQFLEADEEKNTKSRLYFILSLLLGLSVLLLIL